MLFLVEPRCDQGIGPMRALNSAAISCLLLLWSAGAARAAEEVSVEATRRDEALEVVCRAMLDAPLDLVWRTLTDYDRLMDEDAKKFAADLARWIQQSSTSTVALQLEEDEVSDAHNVQLALRELGQDVTLDVAASVWKHYSQSLMASWMSGAETVQSAARTLYLNCPRDSRTMNP